MSNPLSIAGLVNHFIKIFDQARNHGTERGVAGTDPSTRGRSPVVLEVRFRSRAQTKAEIQSEIVLGYLHYLGFFTI